MIDDGPSNTAPEKFVAAKYSTGKVVIMKILHLNVFLVNYYRGFVSSLSNKFFCGGKNLCATYSSCVLFSWFVAGLKKQVSCLLVPCVLIIQDEAFFKSCELTT